jgi:hypothetical protein
MRQAHPELRFPHSQPLLPQGSFGKIFRLHTEMRSRLDMSADRYSESLAHLSQAY